MSMSLLVVVVNFSYLYGEVWVSGKVLSECKGTRKAERF